MDLRQIRYKLLFRKFKNSNINITKPLRPNKRIYKKLINDCISNGFLTNYSKYVKRLENELSIKYNLNPLVLSANGTLALQTLISSINKVPNKKEIIVPSYTFVATVAAIINAGFVPKFADVKRENGTIDPNYIKKIISSKTIGIVGVHLFGNPCDYITLNSIAKDHSIKLFFDASHAFEVRQNNQPIINFGDGSSLSFHATKIFTTGEGGAVISSDKEIIDFTRNFINHGIFNESEVGLIGCNGKMSELNAIYGLSTIDQVPKAIKKRKKIYYSYKKFFLEKTINVESKLDDESCHHNYSYAPFCFENKKIRDGLYDHLRKKKIFVRKYFSPLISEFKPFKKYLSKKTNLSASKYFADHILCFPIHPYLSNFELKNILSEIEAFFKPNQ